MLIDMLPSMPEVSEDILEWRPISYAEHFTVTGFRAKELAIAAYEAADPGVRAQFAEACTAVEAAIADVQSAIRNNPDALSDASARGANIYDLISLVGGVINAGEPDAFDGAFAAAAAAATDDQAAIDALFD